MVEPPFLSQLLPLYLIVSWNDRAIWPAYLILRLLAHIKDYILQDRACEPMRITRIPLDKNKRWGAGS